MAAFRELPFQFQQRGPELAGALQTPDKLARFHEQRDQDLENYLAGLGGAKNSVAIINCTQVTGGGTTLAVGGQTFDGVFGGAIGPLFNPTTGEYLGKPTDYFINIAVIYMKTNGVGMAAVSGVGNALEGSSTCTIVGNGAMPSANMWRLGGSFAQNAGSWNAQLAANPGGLIGTINYTPLFPGASYVNAGGTEPNTLTVDVDFSSSPAYVLAIAW